uniref:Transmembrane protein 110 n=1 Tax=Phallusia mammillata TaxID=59560 RepID=A0A6F9DVJ8_9ASCI|nr:transmembrane protein 110 [Phallusia mammillata]
MNDTVVSPHCQRGELVGSFGIFVQGILGAIAFSTLLIKRWREPKLERRSWRIWFYDTSKQGFGAGFIHFANVYLADAAGEDPCTWYLISFLLDSTVGLFIIYLGFKLTQKIVHYYKCTTLYFGEYGYPPKCSAWLGQCALYLLVMLCEKVLVGLMVIPPFWKNVRHIMLQWIKNPQVEVVVVMLIVPFCVNALMFWVVDNLLMRKPTTKRIESDLDAYEKKSARRKHDRETMQLTKTDVDREVQYFKIKSHNLQGQEEQLSCSENRDSTDEEVLLLHRFSSETNNPSFLTHTSHFNSDDDNT